MAGHKRLDRQSKLGALNLGALKFLDNDIKKISFIKGKADL